MGGTARGTGGHRRGLTISSAQRRSKQDMDDESTLRESIIQR